ncbi:MerR family transcriptional regulator [Streptomyces lunaelactis]|uniref:MerR family transcriptional regulator n=1 Tax=Streptomyces lunaelactis TaxID=1535768 RepID=UPI001584A23B|nr:MerR family transcriptional regulator [Streptomyces lunaelactis]NUK04363.1 MerR family transcriptional regulator [Streptomyces lunaelactis]NUK10613.1 MerR family transcriptional regulator [Streptomyces lunaelactis]NUK19148.1 MerR family transcriptional regulator [Streptomyces lunaelactis]NUK26132.1 MerR family transcriptional regulator [Streptomyces lunaelactis]NUK36398.1 MerR family transcriptional regulator [Streptomyces lunaelactis]
MRISELSRRSGVPITTIKHYLREGLLPPGRATAATQAEYDDSHVRRLRLIRALIAVRGLSVNTTRELLGAVSEHESDTHQILGLALGVRPVTGTADEEGPRDAEADALLAEMGWEVSDHAPAKAVITETLETLRSLGVDYDWRSLVPYATLAKHTATLDLDQLADATDPLERAERAVLLTVLLEPALLALRRLAQEDESAKRYGG